MIIKGNQLKPNFSFELEGMNSFISCINDEPNLALIVKTSFSIDSIKCIETSPLDRRSAGLTKAKTNSIMDRDSMIRDS